MSSKNVIKNVLFVLILCAANPNFTESAQLGNHQMIFKTAYLTLGCNFWSAKTLYSVKGEEEMLFCKFPIPNIGINSKTEKNRVNDSGILCWGIHFRSEDFHMTCILHNAYECGRLIFNGIFYWPVERGVSLIWKMRLWAMNVLQILYCNSNSHCSLRFWSAWQIGLFKKNWQMNEKLYLDCASPNDGAASRALTL